MPAPRPRRNTHNKRRQGAGRRARPLRIALTGGIASGKSTIAKILRLLGIEVIEADEISHQVLEDEAIKFRIRNEFGDTVFDRDGRVNRRNLRNLVFRKPEMLKVLEGIVHPEIRRRLKKLEEEALARGKVVVSVIPLLFEKGLADDYDYVWVAYAPKDVCVRRIQERDGVSLEQANMELAAQMSLEEKARRADVVIHTDIGLEELRRQIEALISHL
ncbi:MAG: dephospho-CoA kinase [bacterium JZ-2024 1]